MFGARKVIFLREGTHQLEFANLRGKPGKGRLKHCNQRKDDVHFREE